MVDRERKSLLKTRASRVVGTTLRQPPDVSGDRQREIVAITATLTCASVLPALNRTARKTHLELAILYLDAGQQDDDPGSAHDSAAELPARQLAFSAC